VSAQLAIFFGFAQEGYPAVISQDPVIPSEVESLP